MAGAAVAAAPAAATTAAQGYEYKISFKGTGSLNLTDNDGTCCQDAQVQSSWQIAPPEPVTLWIPKFNGPPGQVYTAMADADDSNENAGSLTETGHYAENPSGDGPVPVSYTCQGTVALLGSRARFTVDVGPYDPTPSIQTDFLGQMESVTNPSSCDTNPQKLYAPQTATGFDAEWFPAGTIGNSSDDGEMLAVGTLIPPQDIGLQSFSLGPAQDYNHVTDPGACVWSDIGQNCKLKFTLGGEYQFTLMCAGTVSGDAGGALTGTCGSGGGTGTGPGTGPGTGTGSGPGGSGKPPSGSKTKCKVPRLAGETLAKAKQALKGAHCAVGKVTKKKSRHVKKGRVISSKPKAGSTGKKGKKIALTVSRGRR
jgi:hypothetical protein